MSKVWKEKVTDRFIGGINERDEYQTQEINKELAFTGIGLWSLNMIAMFIMFLIDTINNTPSIGTTMLVAINMIYSLYTTVRTRKNGLMNVDCATEEEYMEKRKLIRRGAVKAGMMFSFLMVFMNCYLDPFLTSSDIVFSLFDTIVWACSGIFFGIIGYVFPLLHLKKLY